MLSLEALAARIHLLRTGVQSCPCAPKTQGEVETQSRFHNFHGDRIAHGGEGHPVYGVTNQKGGFALLSEDGRAEDMKTMPHEIGRVRQIQPVQIASSGADPGNQSDQDGRISGPLGVSLHRGAVDKALLKILQASLENITQLKLQFGQIRNDGGKSSAAR